MDREEKRKIILDNYNDDINKKEISSSDYMKVNSRNFSCIDNIDLYIKFNNNIIDDIKFNGEACVIAISSTSLLIKYLIGKSVEEALNIISNYENMIEGLSYDQSIIKDLIAFDDIGKQPSRKICATLASRKIKELLEKSV